MKRFSKTNRKTNRRTNRRINRRTNRRINRKTNRKTNRKNVKFYMITYKDNMKFAKETHKILKKEWGISSKIISGYKIDKDKYSHTNVLFHGVRDKLIPSMLKGNTDAYYIEDDVRFTSDPLDIPKKDVVWSVYRKGSLDKTKFKKQVITGSQAIFLSRKAQKELKKHMDQSRAIHIDGYFSKYIRETGLSFHQMIPKIGYEQDHKSIISKDKDWLKYKNPN